MSTSRNKILKLMEVMMSRPHSNVPIVNGNPIYHIGNVVVELDLGEMEASVRVDGMFLSLTWLEEKALCAAYLSRKVDDTERHQEELYNRMTW